MLGGDPGEATVHFLGEWSLRLLIATLAVSPLRRLGFSQIARHRRKLGVATFVYAVLHLVSFQYFYVGFAWTALVREVAERPYVTVGFAALLLLLPLAVTSTNGWRRRLASRWRVLHRLVYPATAAALLHLLWLTKDGYLEWFAYTLVVAILAGERLWQRYRK